MDIPFDDKLIDALLEEAESPTFEVKRLGGNISKIIESIVAFANTDGGLLIVGLEDPDKAKGRQRVFGLQENIILWDELRRNIKSRITDNEHLPINILEFRCTLRDGKNGSIAILKIGKSPVIHSIVNNGTWKRLAKSNKELTANEIHELQFARGTITAETQTVDVPFDLLETNIWQEFARMRSLTRPIDEAMYHIGLAKKVSGEIKPVKASVLLFAEDPAGLLAGKASIRIFHYRGIMVDASPNTNLVKTPKTISGPLIRQIQQAFEYVVEELAEKVQMGKFGFEVVQKYPVRVIKEAITNAVIHRDYHLNADIQIRIFTDRIEIESPGLFAGPVTISNIDRAGTHSRNPQIVNSLREFPNPPNLDAGEGVRMMFQVMRQEELYPPLYRTKEQTGRDTVMVVLLNQNRPTTWEQVSDYINRHGNIANKQMREILGTEDTLKASKLLKEWVDNGLLMIVNPNEGTKSRKYTKPDEESSNRIVERLFR